jgi:hypothetical protein
MKDKRKHFTRIRFQYNYSPKKYTTVEFDVVKEGELNQAKNITLKSNFHHHWPINPEIKFNVNKNEWGFWANGVHTTNGDIQQIINRIFKMLNALNVSK